MWLIDNQTMELKEFMGVTPPPYAILSHTWEDQEVSFREMMSGPSGSVKEKKGYAKIRQTCLISAQEGLRYAWVDTCCIDKSSSSELSEAINSMYRWYKDSAVCYAYLSDLDSQAPVEGWLSRCRWFSRGWTLQELIAPSKVVFYDMGWTERATKQSMKEAISRITRIPAGVLLGKSTLESHSVAARMSWASKRTTTRIEDMAYCLLGLFDVNMPLLYGEGNKAFLRLQEEILRKADMSLFAWKWNTENENYCGLFAQSVADFETCNMLLTGTWRPEISVTSRGICILSPNLLYSQRPSPHFFLNVGGYFDRFGRFALLYVVLQRYKTFFVRDNSFYSGIYRVGLGDPRALLPYDLPKVYLAQLSSEKISKPLFDEFRERSCRLELEDGLRVFEVVPETIWDPAHSIIIGYHEAAVVLIGRPGSINETMAIFIPSGRRQDEFHILPATSPALPSLLRRPSLISSDGLKPYDQYPVHDKLPQNEKWQSTWSTEVPLGDDTVHVKMISYDKVTLRGILSLRLSPD